jgi:hypothetical protein
VHVDADRVAFLREHPDETLLVSLSRDGSELPALPEIVRGEQLLAVGEGVAPRARIWEVRV